MTLTSTYYVVQQLRYKLISRVQLSLVLLLLLNSVVIISVVETKGILKQTQMLKSELYYII